MYMSFVLGVFTVKSSFCKLSLWIDLSLQIPKMDFLPPELFDLLNYLFVPIRSFQGGFILFSVEINKYMIRFCTKKIDYMFEKF